MALLRQHFAPLPPHTAFATRALLDQVERLNREVRAFEEPMRAVFQPTPTIEWLMTLPGVGFILVVVIALELGDIRRFPDAERFARYAGSTPRVRPSGGGEDALRHAAPRREPLPQVGFRGSCDPDQPAARPTPRTPCEPAYARVAGRKGHLKARGGGAASRGGDVLDADQGGSVSRTDAVGRFVHAGVSAAGP
jgi:hypothetical protein